MTKSLTRKTISKSPTLLLAAVLLALLLAACGDSTTPTGSPSGQTALPAAPTSSPSTSSSGYAGWAIDAYPDMSYDQMLADLTRMKQAGANVVWISHANPARPYAQEREVGLNPSVFSAFKDPAQYAYKDAISIVEATKNMLKACQALGLKAVLSVGYQTQMGQLWSQQHPQDLRRRADGKLWQVMNGNDPYASVYSPTFQQDLRDYYVWIEYEFVHSFRDTIEMLNLADEPLGGDYSTWADQEFQKRNGYSFAEVGNLPDRQTSLGRFQANVITDFMTLGAGYWNEITPGLPVTMSFDGGAMREENGLPNIESLFANAPTNFVLTWDMYARDRGSLDKPINENDISRLYSLVKRIGGFSARYNKPVWFWSAGNSWGLGQTATDPGTIADAEANLLYLPLLMNQTGGHLAGIAVWNYNIRSQGLYNYSCCGLVQKATWNEDDMFARVSQQFATVRAIMAEPLNSPEVLYLRPPEWQYQLIGQTKADYFLQLMDWGKLDALDRSNVAGVEAGHWPVEMPAGWGNLKTVIALAPAEFYTAQDIAGLKNFVGSGGSAVVSLDIAGALLGENVAVWSDTPLQLSLGKGRLFVSRTPVYQLFGSKSASTYGDFWQTLFGRPLTTDDFTIQTSAGYLRYRMTSSGTTSTTAGPAPDWPTNWSGQNLARFASNGTSQPFVKDSSQPPLQRSEFIFGLSK